MLSQEKTCETVPTLLSWVAHGLGVAVYGYQSSLEYRAPRCLLQAYVPLPDLANTRECPPYGALTTLSPSTNGRGSLGLMCSFSRLVQCPREPLHFVWKASRQLGLGFLGERRLAHLRGSQEHVTY